MKDGKYSNNVQNCKNSDLYGSHLNHEEGSQDDVHESKTHNENNMTCDFCSLYITQTTTLTNHCLCTCCHKTDIPGSQCIIFKKAKYNFGNAVVWETLSNRFSIPTSKEYICKECDKHLLVEKMPINSVTSWIRLTSHKPQQKCIHCNSIPTDNFLHFDKTKYGENTHVNQMTENDEQNIICNKCHSTILRESLVICLTCDKTMKKCWHLNLIWTNTHHWKNTILEMLKSKRMTSYIYKSCHLQLQQNVHVCCNTDVQKDICKVHNKAGYDFTGLVVSQCLGHVLNPANNENQYICISCDKRLIKNK